MKHETTGGERSWEGNSKSLAHDQRVILFGPRHIVDPCFLGGFFFDIKMNREIYRVKNCCSLYTGQICINNRFFFEYLLK